MQNGLGRGLNALIPNKGGKGVKEIKIILKNGEKIEFKAKESLPCNDKTIALYLTDDNALYTIRVDEIAMSYEKTLET